VENAELDVALEELETRLERLRALYEQYFMGIERIEPAIPRKDIDRRIYVLRREKIRNTAKRFKLQTIISRYNTFQQYWQRICREIENGTYKRHVIKAERIAPGQILTIAARKRLGRAALEAMDTDAASESAPPSSGAPSVRPSAPPSSPPLPSVRPAAPAATQQRLAPPPKPVPPPKPGPRPLAPANAPASPNANANAPPAPARAPAAAPPPPARAPNQPPAATAAPPTPAPPAAPARRAPSVRPPFESLDLDMDFLGDWDPGKAAKRPAQGPARPFGKPLSQPMNTPPTPGSATAPRAAAPKPAPPTPPPPRAPSAPPPKPVTIPPRPAPVTKPLTAEPAPPPAAARPLAPIIPGTTPAKPAVPKPPAQPAAPAAGSGVDDRVRELHARLVEAKRQTQDSAAVSMEGLAKSMKATEAKLREQHKNRKIDFDVVIKDGKAVLKPIVR